MPGLLRGVARTAVVAGTATAVSNRVSRRQAGRWAAQDVAATGQNAPAQQSTPAPPPPEPAASGDAMDSRIAQLKELAQLKEQGILTDDEFAAQKSRILGS
ncbi:MULTISPECIES: SHOCT domain-containing protein [unclassified Streptomyces]|uniref:SHOCT domain-containing protein n=1 Tax=unclassified Streptomyces TaxID=2593676 RepID=UPI0011E84778|nr:SHOCT domain-containing protein [Streptomyces sp. sk2.1]TXS71343.1 SHOCT domain-containing protein [Streptomyces sp. sk2.1]